MPKSFSKIEIIDSHTEGEPTRVVLAGGPDLGTGSMRQRIDQFRELHDEFRCQVIHEPRGFDAIVGALVCEPVDPSHVAGVLFFNNAGYLEMCGHGTIGLAVTLHHLGKIEVGAHSFETPVGIVDFELKSPNVVTIRNVPSYRFRKEVQVEVPEIGIVTGDIAWGGNWFFLVRDARHELHVKNLDLLLDDAKKIKAQLGEDGITGESGAEIDHVEFFGPPRATSANSRNFVLCPGGAYDRSPCGTGTSAKLACLAADGRLQPGEVWVQESIVGSVFECSYDKLEDGRIAPSVTGRAYICGQGELLLDNDDPFRNGIGV